MTSLVYDFADIHKRMFGPNKKGSEEDFLKYRTLPPSPAVMLVETCFGTWRGIAFIDDEELVASLRESV